MTAPPLPALTTEELTSLVNLAITASAPKIPAIHLARLVLLGYLVVGPDGPLVTGDGLIRTPKAAEAIRPRLVDDLTGLDSLRTK